MSFMRPMNQLYISIGILPRPTEPSTIVGISKGISPPVLTSDPDVLKAASPFRHPQFSKNEDFGQYPRDRAADLAKLTQAGVNALFEPTSLYGGACAQRGCIPTTQDLLTTMGTSL